MTELRALSEGRIPLFNFDNLGWETNKQNRIHTKSGPPALRLPFSVGCFELSTLRLKTSAPSQPVPESPDHHHPLARAVKAVTAEMPSPAPP